MAPDAASVAAGRKLAEAKQWKLLGASDTHLWGEMQGSGAKPYQTCIEREGPVFHCTCPSRKFPCKHGLGLAFIEAGHAGALSAADPPAWVAEWVNKRAEREERKQIRAEAASQPVDAETATRRAKDQERRAQARTDKSRDGMAFVSQWLRDTLRQGMAAQAEQPYRYWDELAARTVDAQIPGLARHFRQMPALRHARAHWQAAWGDSLARLHLLCAAFQRYETLTPQWRSDLDAALGLAQDKEALLAADGVADRWCVLGTAGGEEDGLRHQRTWLYGERSARTALLLDFATRGQVLPVYGSPGSVFEGELVFYPGVWPQRGLIKHAAPAQAGATLTGALADVQAAREHYVSAAEKLPWVERVAITVRAVTPWHRDGGWCVVDGQGEALPLSADCSNAWELLAASGGQALDLFGEFDGEALLPLSLADARGVRALPQGQTRVQAALASQPDPVWREALTVALLGTGRQQGPLSAAGPVGAVLERIYPQAALPADAEARAAALLDALSVLSVYRRGAHGPLRLAPLPAPCADDAWEEAAAAAADALRHILDAKDSALLQQWLALAAAYAKRCPAFLLPSLLDGAAPLKVSLVDLAAVLGRRGAWLAQFRDEWRAVLAQAPGADPAQLLRQWEEGGASERRAALQALRGHDPEMARARLAAALPGEPAAVRAELLNALAQGLGMADESLLETCLADKSQEVRQTAAQWLSLLPQSGLRQRTRARAQAWLVYQPRSGLLSRLGSKPGDLVLMLPEDWDAAWGRDGLIEKAPRGKGAKAWWLEQTLALVPPATWSLGWGLAATDCLALLEGHEWRDAVRAGWLQATLAQRDADWALAWLDAPPMLVPEADLRASLWQLLAPELRAQHFVARLQAARGDALVQLLHQTPDLGAVWSEPVSQAIIAAWRQLVGSFDPARDYGSYADLRDAALRLAPSLLPRFERQFARELADEGPWHKILNETRERLRFRHAMHAALSQQDKTGGSIP